MQQVGPIMGRRNHSDQISGSGKSVVTSCEVVHECFTRDEALTIAIDERFFATPIRRKRRSYKLMVVILSNQKMFLRDRYYVEKAPNRCEQPIFGNRWVSLWLDALIAS